MPGILSLKRSLLWAWICALSLSFCLAYELGNGERIIQTLEDDIDAENFTNYRLLRDGQLKLVLRSLKGDVDIFASSSAQHPTYYNYDIKSETCGTDVITVPFEMPRPVFVGLYGHPHHLHSRYSLTIVSVPKPKSVTYEDLVAEYEKYYFDENAKSKSFDGFDQNSESAPDSGRSSHHEEDDMPVFWKIFLGILEFGIEVIL